MKKRSFVALLLVSFLLISSAVFAAPKVMIDNQKVQFDVDPVIINGRTMVPFRQIFEALGLKVEWNERSRIAVAYDASTYVAIRLEDDYGNLNGELVKLDAQATIIGGRVLVPLRFISEAFGNEVKWDAKTETAYITSGFKQREAGDPLPIIGSKEKLLSLLAYNNRFEDVYYTNRIMVEEELMFDAAVEKAEAPMESGAAADSGYSETNVQVQGVDEADIVKTDGSFVYHVRHNDIVITEVNGVSMTKKSTILLNSGFTPSEIFIKDNKVIVIGSESFPAIYDMTEANKVMSESLIWPYQPPSSKVLIYDVSNKANPVLKRELMLEGDYLTSRMIGNDFYMISNRYLYSIYNEKDNIQPHVIDSLDNQVQTIGFEAIRYFPDSTSNNYLILAGLNLDQLDEPADIQTFVGSGNNVYMSKDHLYVALSKYKYEHNETFYRTDYEKTTSVYKFKVADGSFKYLASGDVPGHILNQFAMDESASNFRIATTTGDMWRDDEGISKNNVYVLNSSMTQIGSLEGIAPGEKIYSVRFMGDRAYMVTYRQVDPFFVIDMSNAYAPRILGYLKIPGYSDYLHPFDANHIIGFGKDTIETKTGVLMDGFKMAMFDVSDVTNPIEKFKVNIGTRGTDSELLNNHKALMHMKSMDLMAFPITVYEQGDRGSNHFSFQGAYVYEVSSTTGFVLKGTSTHLSEEDYKMAGDYWYSSDQNTRRILYINNVVYTFSNQGIKAHDASTMNELAEYKY